jgi:ATP-dependent helicase YprA (DUF1998 family)
MTDPQETLKRAVDRAAEITWWNRNMTELADVPGVDNAPEFVEDELIEQKGPYVEFVEAPAFDDRTGTELLRQLDYDDAVMDAVREELFGGDEGHFYRHQAQTMENIAETTNDNVLAVPTATGKTESFFLPILQHCLETNDSGLKSIVLYPMKTLGVDQLNRFVAYLDQINRHREPSERITVGIWDSDTPQRVGTRGYEIEDGSYVRGLECPREDGKKLKIFGDVGVGTDNNSYPWLRVTRKSIRQGVDILLTNPEALDYMFVSDNQDTRDILGSAPSENPVEHIVFDEAHVWSGIQGTAISLLARRLKEFYDDRDPQVTMVSATVDNPRELASDLTGSDESDIDAVEFSGRSFPIRGEPDFGRFSHCDVEDIVETLALARAGDMSIETACERFDIRNAVETLDEVGLLQDGETLGLGSAAGPWLRKSIDETLDQLLEEPGFDSPSDVIETRRGRNRLNKAILEASGTGTGWVDFVVDKVPEVAQFAAWFDEDTTGAVGFLHYNRLLDEARQEGADYAEGALTTAMAFGRLAGIVTEKYHSFLKPPAEVHWCRDCEAVTRNPSCTECGSRLPELQFCKRCNEVYIEADDGEDGVSGSRDETTFIPIRGWRNDDDCPGCERSPNLTDVTIPTPTLFSYMLTEMSRDTPSEKALVFSDSRATAESVADKIIDTEYGLMAETLYIRELLENGGRQDNYDVFKEVSQRLREEYWEPLIQTEMDEDGDAFNFLVAYRDRIDEQALLFNCEHLLESALMTAGPILDTNDPVELVVRHKLYTLFALDPGTGFTKNSVSFDGLTRSKILDRLDSRVGFDRETIDSVLDETLREFLDAGILIQAPYENVRSSVSNSNAEETKKEKVRTYLKGAQDELDAHRIVENAESGLLTRSGKKDDSDLVLLRSAAVCPACYESYPAFSDGTSIDTCPDCGTELIVEERFPETESGELVADPGYTDVPSEWSYALDHWAHDVTTPIRGGSDPEFITVGIHKGDTPHAVRGAIEEGFRRDDPDVNVVSATPTMELGVDIGTLETVGQVGIPPTLTNYVQRSGRTGRSRGSSSLVVTAIRGNHPVDGHYYSDLEAFLRELEPVTVPNPFEFEELLAGHVVTEVFGYLSRNPHEQNVFQKMYSLQETNKSLEAFVDDVRRHIEVLQSFTLDERADAVKRHLDTVFGDPGVDVFERIFEQDGPLSLTRRVDNTYSKLITAGGAASGEDVIEQNSRLDQWLQQLGFLANYRSFGDQFPVTFGSDDGEISFEGSGRLHDMFPGEENDFGGTVTLHGNKYLVDDVRGTKEPLVTVAVCENDDCGRPFHGYDTDTAECPHCGQELSEVAVHGIDSVECTRARGGQRNYSTRGIMTSHVQAPSEQTERTTTTTMFGLDCDVEYGHRDVTDFVSTFERYHSASSGKELLRSEALIEQDTSTSSGSASWQEQMEDVQQELYRPVGQQYGTRGVTLRFDEAAMRNRIEPVSHETASWAQALTSLEQALKRAISVVTESDQDDFRVVSRTHDGEVAVNIVDARQGGNGVSWQVYDRLSTVERQTTEVADCHRCVDFCDECLLLERTPAHYLENGLLDRRTLDALLTERASEATPKPEETA